MAPSDGFEGLRQVVGVDAWVDTPQSPPLRKALEPSRFGTVCARNG